MLERLKEWVKKEIFWIIGIIFSFCILFISLHNQFGFSYPEITKVVFGYAFFVLIIVLAFTWLIYKFILSKIKY